jgi:Ca2+-transporting ATPase
VYKRQVLIIALVIYGLGLHRGYSEKEVRAFCFIALTTSNIAIILSNRSWTRNIFQILMTPNPTVKWVVGGAVLFLALVLNIPFLTEIFLFERVDLLEISICAAAGLLSITGFEIYKLTLHKGV